MDFKISMGSGSVTISDVIAPGLSNQIQQAVQASLNLIRSLWIQEAQKQLKSTSGVYLSGLVPKATIHPMANPGFSGWIGLAQGFPQMLESGFAPFDMKHGFSRGRKVHNTKSGGWFTTIPFYFGKPKNQNNLPELPKAINQKAKKLTMGARLTIPGQGERSWIGYQRKTNEYNGLTRIVNSYQNKPAGAMYSTFRRVSNNSDQSSWIHPGFHGAHILEKIKPRIKPMITAIFNEALHGIG